MHCRVREVETCPGGLGRRGNIPHKVRRGVTCTG